MRISNHPCDSWKSSQLFRSSLRIATRNQDTGFRVFAVNPPDCLTNVVIGVRRHRTGIQNNHFGRLGRSRTEPLGCQRRFYGSAISLRSPASEVLYVKMLHSFDSTTLDPLVGVLETAQAADRRP